mgnify:CR=1 FL=1
MTESEAKTTKKTDLSTGSNQGFQINISKEHGNWLNVGELIHSIHKPISFYVNEIVQALHEKLCKDLSVAKCSTPERCNKKTKPSGLCKSCKSWFDKINGLHKKSNNSHRYKNCNSAKWSEDHWEVAKFFMPTLGSNLSTVKDAESTDISSLLNVLEWLKFPGKTQENVDLVRKLRSEVRNTWAHAPQQELKDDEMAQGFSIATEFLEDLEKVWCHTETGKCSEHLQDLKTSRVTNVVESELQSLLQQRRFLNEIKDEITKNNVERSSDKSAIEENKQKLTNLERAFDECSRRMSNFESFKDNINEQFNKFAEDLKSFRSIPEDIHEIRNSIGQIRDDLAKMNKRQKQEREPTSCLPDRLPNFSGRVPEIQKVITFLMKEEKAVVSLHGGPGFGKTAIAIEVSHNISKDHNIPVVFSQLAAVTSADEMIRQLCLDVGVNSHEDKDPKSSLIFWLKNIKGKVIFVMDDIDNLLKDTSRSAFYQFVQLLRKNSNQHCQIITTSRTAYEIRELVTGEVNVEEMDVEACIELMRKQCPQLDDEFLQRLAELCGKIPLAMCIAGSRVQNFKNPDELLKHLQQQPMKTLECPESNEYVYRAINMSYKKCSFEEQETLDRLAVFEGSFNEEAAQAVIDKENLDTNRLVKSLFSQSLIKYEPTKQLYSIHLLIQHFLVDQLAERAREQMKCAEQLMVKHYLKLGDELTMESYSKEGYKESREALKKEAHNIQKVLKICSQKNDPTTSKIPDCLANSKVYTTSARHFSLFVRTIIPGTIIDKFLQRCAEIAQERKQHAIKINFDLLLAEQERKESIGKSDTEHLTTKMEKIKEEFETHNEDIEEDKSLCAYYFYQYGRYLSRKAEEKKDNYNYKESCKLQAQARSNLEESLRLRETLTSSLVGKADKIFSLLHLGNAYKLFKKMSEKAKECYTKAIRLSQNDLGDHELTSSCHKSLGDLFLKIDEPEKAEKEYNTAKEMRENLKLDASERHVLLLNNLGNSLTKSARAHEAIEHLENARDMAEKLAENDQPNTFKAKVYTSLATAHHSLQAYSQDAVKYAKKAMELGELENVIKNKEYKELKNILQTQL